MVKVLAPNPGVIRLNELRLQTELVEGESVLVRALTPTGTVVEVELWVASKWGATSWRLQLACPGCTGPCSVLRWGTDGFRCNACAPRRLSAHQRKNTADWQVHGGREVDMLVRKLTGSQRHGAADASQLGARVEAILQKSVGELSPLVLAAIHLG